MIHLTAVIVEVLQMLLVLDDFFYFFLVSNSLKSIIFDKIQQNVQ